MKSGISVEELLAELGEDGAQRADGARGEQRARVVSAMRRKHVELVHSRRRVWTPRKRAALLLVAAAAALSATALAATGGFGRLGRRLEGERARAAAPRTTTRANAASGRGSPNSSAPPPAASAAVHEDATAAATVPIASDVTAARAAPPLPTTKATATPRAAVQAATEDGELATVNRLFAEAKQARREHRDADALGFCQRLLSQYPHSVLAQEAAVERFRALARLGRTADARRFAAGYLASYPNGFAAQEARALTAPASVVATPDASGKPARP